MSPNHPLIDCALVVPDERDDVKIFLPIWFKYAQRQGPTIQEADKESSGSRKIETIV